MGCITIQFAKGTEIMAAGKTLMDLLKVQTARALAARSASPLILSGTLAFAGLSAAALTPSHLSPAPSPVMQMQGTPLNLDAPHTFCFPSSAVTGHTICHILASQVHTVPNLGCTADPDGDGTFICVYATPPRVAN